MTQNLVSQKAKCVQEKSICEDRAKDKRKEAQSESRGGGELIKTGEKKKIKKNYTMKQKRPKVGGKERQ